MVSSAKLPSKADEKALFDATGAFEAFLVEAFEDFPEPEVVEDFLAEPEDFEVDDFLAELDDFFADPDGVAFDDFFADPDGVAFDDFFAEPDGVAFDDFFGEPDGVAFDDFFAELKARHESLMRSIPLKKRQEASSNAESRTTVTLFYSRGVR